MPNAPRWCLAAVFCVLLPGAGRAATEQAIGSWVVSCATPGNCLMRHESWVLPPGTGRPSAALEVQRRGDSLVPVVTLRGLSTQAAIGGMLAMQASVAVSFDNGPASDLACDLDGGTIVCAPGGDAVALTAAELPTARSATVRIQITVPGLTALPAQQRTLALQSTPEALARFRAVGPSGESLPIEPGLDWTGFVDKVLRGLGFQNGAADLLAHAR
ncbi:MAG TPA: hypothetical protein VGG99_13655 [Acetobacteraceae bacterium]|jgi:hypothetical protein